MPIQSFACAEVEEFFYKGTAPRTKGWAQSANTAKRKLDMLHAAHTLADLRVPPNNRLEALKGNLTGRYSIRVNAQWRVMFTWTTPGPCDVDIVDYH